MSSKRSASTELNHENWNEDNEPEEAGTFAKATNDILERRIIKTARRRFPSRDGAVKSAFETFPGFKTTPATSSSPFGFLANVSTASSLTTSAASTTTVNASSRNIASNGSKIPENDTSKIEDTNKPQTLTSTSLSKTILTKKGNEKTKRHSSDYYAKLKGLNESVATWIKTHVDTNPFCILTPIFKDYEKYLKEITSKEESTKARTLHTSESTTQAAQNDDQKDTSAETKLETSSFGTSNANTKPASIAGTEWKPEKSIFSNIATNTKSMFGNTEQKTENPKSVFSNIDVTPDKGRSIFGNIESNVTSKSIFGNASSENNPFVNKPTILDGGKTDEEDATSNTKSVAPTFPVSTFSFGQSSTTNNMTAGFSFGSAKPFSFAPQTVKPQDVEDKTDNENKDEEDEEPPKPDFKPVTEEDAVYKQRCKVYVKKNDNFSDRGVGMLYLKPTPNGKTQLIVRADTALGNLLLNTLLTQSIPIKRMNKNTIMLICLPMPDSSPPPVPTLLRVKTSEVADELFETLNKHKE